jgi:thioredoxin reductase
MCPAEEVTVIYKGTKLRAEQSVQEATGTNPKIRILLNREVEGVRGEKAGPSFARTETGKSTFETDNLSSHEINSELFDGLLNSMKGFIRSIIV